jgi:hypothetical protein
METYKLMFTDNICLPMMSKFSNSGVSIESRQFQHHVKSSTMPYAFVPEAFLLKTTDNMQNAMLKEISLL